MAFSREQLLKDNIATKLRRAITMAKVGINDDFKLAHPQWVSQAQQKQFTELTKQITDATKRYQATALQRRAKLVG